MNDPFEGLFPNKANAGLGLTAQIEHEAVRRIRTKSGLKKHVNNFQDLFALGFPLSLSVATPRKGEQLTLLKDIMATPTKTFVYEAWQDALTEDPGLEGQKGIVIRWHGLCVFHDLATHTLGSSGFYTRVMSRYFYLESLDSVIDRAGRAEDW